MSRDARDDVRDATGRDDRGRSAAPRGRSKDAAEVPSRDLTLPRGDAREDVRFHDQTYSLRGSETRTLATVGAFRVVPTADLEVARNSRDTWHGDVDRLARQGLVERTRVSINGRPTGVVALTREGQRLLEAHQQSRGEGRQRFHAGLVKPRELGHDAQLYRVYRAEAERIADEGGRVRRVVLDYELKREYQTFLHRKDRPEDSRPEQEAEAFAKAHGLPVANGHLELPDLRIEYETADGRVENRDVELVTEQYSRAQLSGKAQAGFRLYRTGSGHLRGGGNRRGGTPFDPHHMEWLR